MSLSVLLYACDLDVHFAKLTYAHAELQSTVLGHTPGSVNAMPVAFNVMLL